ncbi:hypothetical protein GN956_G6540 [Arapaima gigas]
MVWCGVVWRGVALSNTSHSCPLPLQERLVLSGRVKPHVALGPRRRKLATCSSALLLQVLLPLRSSPSPPPSFPFRAGPPGAEEQKQIPNPSSGSQQGCLERRPAAPISDVSGTRGVKMGAGETAAVKESRLERLSNPGGD